MLECHKKQNIFADHYEEMIYTLHPRESVIENVEKMIHCGDASFGGAMYVCPECNEWKFVPFHYNRHVMVFLPLSHLNY